MIATAVDYTDTQSECQEHCYDAIPAELREGNQWVCWCYVESGDELTKPPVSPHTGRLASITNPDDWGSFDQAIAACQESQLEGPGFVFTRSDPYAGVDLDDCRDAGSGVITPDAWEIIRRLNSYTEISPSGEGVKIFVKGKLSPGRRRQGHVEMYDQARYFTMTGRHLEGTPVTIEYRQAEIEELYSENLGGQARDTDHQIERLAGLGNDVPDDELIERAKAAVNGDKFDALWRGDFSGYRSRSEADLALCTRLAFWTNRDAERIDRLFRRSGLFRDKWDEKRGHLTYGELTIDKALADFCEGYRPVGEATALPCSPGGTDDTRQKYRLLGVEFADEMTEELTQDWVYPGLFAYGQVTGIGGYSGWGKSSLTCSFCGAAVNDDEFLGRTISVGGIAFFTEESGFDFAPKRQTYRLRGDSRFCLVRHSTDLGALPWSKKITVIESMVDDLGIRLIVLDHGIAWLDIPDQQASDPATVTNRMTPLRDLADRKQIAIIVLLQAHQNGTIANGHSWRV